MGRRRGGYGEGSLPAVGMDGEYSPWTVSTDSECREHVESSPAALLANGERCTDEGAARALDSDQDRDHGIPIYPYAIACVWS